jgi:hypothetical protein
MTEINMNIIEAQLKFNNSLIILLSGLSGTFKNQIGKDLSKLFDIGVISLRKFVKKKYDIKTKLSNDYSFIDYDNVEAYDWDEFNTYIKEKSKTGIIVYGFAFPKDLISFDPHFHFNIKISKEKYINERHKFLKENPKSNKNLVELINSETESMIINNYVFPNYLDYIKKSNIHKFFNANEKKIEQIFDEIYDIIIEGIQKILYKNNQNKNNQNKNNQNNQNKNKNNQNNKNEYENYSIPPDDSSSSDSTISSYNTVLTFDQFAPPKSNQLSKSNQSNQLSKSYLTTLKPNIRQHLDPFINIPKYK